MSAAQQATTTAAVPEIGQAFGGGFFSGITVEDGKRYLNIAAGAAHELVGAWGEYGVKIEGAGSFTDSRANTEAMAAAGSKVAKKALELSIGGHDDWAIPARDVQELQYRHFKPTTEANWQYGRNGDNPNSDPVGLLYTDETPIQTIHAGFREGEPEAFRDSYYWSSTQRSAYYAFYLLFVDGGQNGSVKDYELRVRPVRRELLID